jgi:hypothetical protein
MITETQRLCSDKQSLGNNTPAEYSTSADYAVGDYCSKSGTVYRCTTAITGGETWTSGHWTQDDDGYDSASGSVASSTVVSTNVLDNGTNTRVYDGKLHFIAKLDNAPAGGQSIQAVVETSNNADFSTSGSGVVKTLADSGAIALATANAKKDGVLLDETLNDKKDILRYVRAKFTLKGVFSTGATVTAGEFTEAAPTHVKDFTTAPPANV